jgi:hypothetical protein
VPYYIHWKITFLSQGGVTMKKFTAILLSMVMFVSVFAISPVFAKTKYELYKKNGFNYIIVEDYVQIIYYRGKSSVVEIPSEIDGYKVKKLGISNDDYSGEDWSWGDYDDSGFSRNKYVKEVIVPDSVEEIEPYSFYKCKNLKKVTLGKGVTEIPLELFADCSKLEEVKMPSVTYIGDCAFADCKSLKEIKLPSTVTEIASGAFYDSGLTKFNVGKNIKNIASNIFVGDVFYGTKIKKITVSKDNKKYSAKNGVLYNKSKTKLIYYPRNKKAKKFVIPKTVQKIAVGAFYDSKYLQSVVISKGVKKIGYSAFCDCKQLSKVTFKTKKDVKIGYYAFYNCKSLKKVTIPKNIKTIGSKAFGFKGKGTYGYKDYKIKNFTIKGKSRSQAQKYAKKHGFKFIAI